MNTRLFIFKVAVFLFISFTSYGQYEFIENKGQWHENVKYKLELGNGAIFLENNCLTFNFISTDSNTDVEYSNPHGYAADMLRNAHAYKVNFLNSNKPGFFEDDPAKDYCNYFLSDDASKWASYVRKYKKITYNGIYNGIDLIYYNSENGLKYDFIVHPGANVKDILLEYVGTDMMYLENRELIIGTSVSFVKEGKPYAYQIINGDTVHIACDYNLKKNQISFNFPRSYDKTKELIIDPSLVFSTYSGSTADNWGFTATWDYAGNVYSGGIVFGVGYPTSVGAYQISFAGGGGCDVGIMKYNKTGTIVDRVYATYLGGSTGQEMPHSLVVTENNDLVIMGTTGSADFPTTDGAFSRTFSGGDSVVYDRSISFNRGVDIFVSKLSEDGSQLLGSTYIGGSGNDGLNYKLYYSFPDPVTRRNHVEQHGNDSLYFNYGDGARGEVIVDKNNMIYVGTNTFSTDFPTGINNGYQTQNGGGQDGIVFKLSADMSQLVWSSYLGGSQDDAIFSISLDNAGDVLVTGGTVSHNFPVTPGAYRTTFTGGTTDAFVAKLNPAGNRLLSSTYYGSDKYDNAFFVRTDRQNNIFICGQTKASGTDLMYNAGYSRPNSGQFIAKFNTELTSLTWSTVFGTGNGRPNISITAFAVDICNRIYLSGWGREWVGSYYNAQGDTYTWDSEFGTKGMQVTPDALQSETDGQDFYVMVLDANARNLEYATFFGELHYDGCAPSGRDHVDGGTARFDSKGNIIQSVCASCGGCQRFPTSPDPGAWSNTNQSSNCNDVVFKISITENLSIANFDPVPAGCIPYNVHFQSNSQGTSYFWDFGDGTTSAAENPSHTYTSGGEYTVRLIVRDPGSCNLADTLERIVRIIEPGITHLPDFTICPGENVIIGPNIEYAEGTVFSWSGGSGLNNTNIQNPVASPATTTEYMLIATGVCADTIKQRVIVEEVELIITVSNDTLICTGGSAMLYASSQSPVSLWEWSDNSSFTNILSNSQALTTSPSNSTVYYVRATESVCRTSRIESVLVDVHRFNYSLIPEHILCYGSTATLTLTNHNVSDELTYSWSPLEFIVSGANTNSPVVNPTVPTTFTVTVTSQIGCVTTSQVYVDIDNLTFTTPELTHNLCYGDCNGVAIVSADGIAPYSYVWSNGQTSATVTGLCSGSYSVTVTDRNSCTAVTDIEISSPPQLLADFTGVVYPQCDGIGYGTATVSPYGGVPGYRYQWSFGGGNNATNDQCLIGINTVTVTDANNCVSVVSINMPAPSPFTSSVKNYNMVSCHGFCDGNISVEADLGVEPYTYRWSNGMSGDSIYGLCPGAYMVTVIDDEDCVSHQYINITEPDSLIADAIVESLILCYGQTGDIGLNVSGGTGTYSYRWSDNSTGENLTGVPAGIYYVTVTDENLCEDYSSVLLAEPEELILTSRVKNMLCDDNCNGEIITELTGGTEPYFYRWSNGKDTESIVNLCDGNYELIIRDSHNCRIEYDYNIINEGYEPDLEVDASSFEIFEGESVSLLASSTQNGTYKWDNIKFLNDPYIANPIATPSVETLFRVKFMDDNGCSATDTVRIKVKEVICKDPYIFVPSAFTPNNDGKNDLFKPYYPNSLVTSVYFAVYDRWGNIVYETDKLYDNGWDGTYKGEKLTSDVYVFWLRARCLNGEEYNHRGNVTLLR